MASLYKKPIVVTDPKTGERTKQKSRKWWGRYRDALDREKRVPLAGDKAAAQAMLNEIVRQVERQAAGIADPFEKHRNEPLTKHLADFRKFLINKGSTSDYVATTLQRATAVIEGCGFKRIQDISAGSVVDYLAALRRSGRSVASSNHYLRAVKMFARWLVRDRRNDDDRLTHLSRMNVELDRRRVRRPLSIEEFDWLLSATAVGPEIQKISGPDRTVLYIVGAYTGYRRNEIGSVQEGSFDFESDPPTLTVQASYSKHRRTDILPLRRDFAQRIREWLTTRPRRSPGQPLFAITGKHTAEMLQKDLARARQAWIKEAHDDRERGRREKSRSWLARTKTAVWSTSTRCGRRSSRICRDRAYTPKRRSFARHSDINLTMNTYTRLGVLDQAAAVESLPPVPTGRANRVVVEAKATGTYGQNLPNRRPKKVPTVVPRGANNGAVRLASGTSHVAPDCTESGEKDAVDAPTRNAASPNAIGTCGIDSHQDASLCIVKCERQESNLHPSRDWILSPGRESPKLKECQGFSDAAGSEVPTVVPTLPDTRLGDDGPPDFAPVAAAWALLPEVVKAGISAMVRAVTPGEN